MVVHSSSGALFHHIQLCETSMRIATNQAHEIHASHLIALAYDRIHVDASILQPWNMLRPFYHESL